MAIKSGTMQNWYRLLVYDCKKLLTCHESYAEWHIYSESKFFAKFLTNKYGHQPRNHL